MQFYKMYAAYPQSMQDERYERFLQKVSKSDMLKNINNDKVTPMNVEQTQATHRQMQEKMEKFNLAQNVALLRWWKPGKATMYCNELWW